MKHTKKHFTGFPVGEDQEKFYLKGQAFENHLCSHSQGLREKKSLSRQNNSRKISDLMIYMLLRSC